MDLRLRIPCSLDAYLRLIELESMICDVFLRRFALDMNEQREMPVLGYSPLICSKKMRDLS